MKSEKLRWLAGRGVWVKSYLMAVLLFAVGGVCAAEPTISVTATPRYPWNGVVDVAFTIAGDAGIKYKPTFTAKDLAGNTNVTMSTIFKSNGAAVAATEWLLPGTYKWTWNAEADVESDFASRMNISISATAQTYSVKFNANGGTGTMSNESFIYGTAKALTANAFTRTGYTFDGWAKSASGAKAYSNKQSVSNLTTTANGTYNLYACWKGNSYSVKFNANGGTGTMSNESFTYGTAKALTANAFTRTGFTFDGWAKTASGAKEYSNKQSVSNLTATAGGTFNLYAVWKATGGVQLWANGPYWAECNVGATKPEEYGYYFWWGDTVGYKRNASNNGWVSVKNGASFSFSSGNCPTYGKTTAQLQSAGYIDSTGNLVAKYDAATAHLGAPWRMPMSAELSSLIINCTITWVTRNGVKGRLFTGRGAYASKSIFLPAAGGGYDSRLDGLGSWGRIWSSTRLSGNGSYAWFLYFSSSDYERNYDYELRRGQPVRPVR